MANASQVAPPPPERSQLAAGQDDAPEERRGLGLVGKAVIAMLLVGLLPLAVLGAVGLQRQQERIRYEAEQVMQSNAERIAAEVDEWVDKNLRALQTAARLPAVTSLQPEAQTEVLKALAQVYPWMYLVHTIGPDGMNVARSDGKPLTNYADRAYWDEVIHLGKPVSWESVIGRTSKKPALILAVPIKQGERTVGVLSAAMTVEDISRIVGTWRSGRTGTAFLVDQTGKVVAHPEQEFVVKEVSLKEHPLVASIRKTGLPRLLSFDEKGGREMLGYVQGTRLNWAVAIQQQQEELFAPVRTALLAGLALLAGGALLVAAAAMVSSRLLVQPIVRLTEAADQMSLGELAAPITSTRRDEIGRLAVALERLRKSMRAALRRLEAGRPPTAG